MCFSGHRHQWATANVAFGELGIALFLSCVELGAGSKFFSIVMNRDGLIGALSTFANTLAKSDAPAISYETVYPLTMLCLFLVAQVMVLVFF